MKNTELEIPEALDLLEGEFTLAELAMYLDFLRLALGEQTLVRVQHQYLDLLSIENSTEEPNGAWENSIPSRT